jgi:hypothetical protein
MYEILPYTKARAKAANLIVKPSVKKNKKLDVYDANNKYIATVGQKPYLDYPYYIKEEGKEKADERRRLYHLRHTKNTLNENLAKYLLW